MKKKLFKIILIIVVALGLFVYRYLQEGERIVVSYDRIVDGDTMYFHINGESTKCRLIGINAPEIDSNEAYSYEAKEYCDKLLQNGKRIEIEYDQEAGLTDKYGRHLVYVFIDGELLEETLLKEGLAEVNFVYGDYKYLDRYYAAQDKAKQNKLNIWEE